MRDEYDNIYNMESLRNLLRKRDRHIGYLNDTVEKNRTQYRANFTKARRKVKKLLIALSGIAFGAGAFAAKGAYDYYSTHVMQTDTMGKLSEAEQEKNQGFRLVGEPLLEKDGQYTIFVSVDDKNPEVLFGQFEFKGDGDRHYVDPKLYDPNTNENSFEAKVYKGSGTGQQYYVGQNIFKTKQTLTHEGEGATIIAIKNITPGTYHFKSPDGKDIAPLIELPKLERGTPTGR